MKKAQSQKYLAWSIAVRRAFGSRMRARRHQIAVSQEELGLRCGLDPSYVGQVERGERNLSLENIHRIADGLATSPCSLVAPVDEGLRPEDATEDR